MRLGMEQRRARRQIFPAVGKTVVGDVEDAEDFHAAQCAKRQAKDKRRVTDTHKGRPKPPFRHYVVLITIAAAARAR